ncbi:MULTISPECIES: ferric iron reductase [unclassified Frankia]|uniref:ferric iron reductase n=1 Tax=unclassified Frankia TaxID=2632575 RepID=UPI002023CEC4
MRTCHRHAPPAEKYPWPLAEEHLWRIPGRQPSWTVPAQARPPLAETLEAAARVLDGQSGRIGRPGRDATGWLCCADLLADGALDRELRAMSDVYGYSREVAATHFLSAYAGGVAGFAIAAYMLHSRVPDVCAAGMSLHAAPGGWFDVTAFHSGRVTVLADDPALPAAALPATGDHRPGPLAGRRAVGASGVSGANGPTTSPTTGPPARPAIGAAIDVAGDRDALRQRLAAALVGHFEPLVLALRARARLGPSALWGMVAAQCGRTFLLTERVTRDPDVGRVEADAFFALASPPMRARPAWFEFVHRGRRQTAMRRGSCCLAHRMSSQYCTTCPFTPDSEREARLREWIDTQGDGGLAVG